MSAAPLHVILAGSDPADRDWVGELLRSGLDRRCTVSTAHTGEAALARLARLQDAKDHILVTSPLVDMRPLELLARLTEGGGIPSCPVIVIAPGSGRELGPELLRAGAQDYIGEDWLSPYVVARAVENALVRWSMEHDLCRRDAALQRSEAFARGVLNSLPHHVLVLDDRGVLQAVNDSWERFTRMASGPLSALLPGANYLEACSLLASAGDAGAQAVLESLCKVIAGQLPECVVEYPWQWGGQDRWILMHGRRPFHGEGLVVSHVDVTRLKQALAALQSRERELQTLADNTPAILARFDSELRCVFVSAAIERLTGQGPEQLIGKPGHALGLPRALWDRWETALYAALREREPQAVAFSLDVEEGARHFSGRFVPEFSRDGTIEHVLGVLHDDTEQKRVEENVSRLLEEERHYAHLLSRMAEASRLVHASLSADAIADVLTRQAREILGARQATTTLTLDGPCTREVRAVSLCCEQGECEPIPPATEPCAPGQVLTVKLSSQAGQKLGVLQLRGREDGEFTAEDEAVLVQLAAIASSGLENARLYASLREADHRKDEFLATLAHELRNPLAPIRNGLEILRRSGQLAGPAARARDMMERQLSHMVRLVDDLLDVSRISRGKVDLRLQRLNLQTVLDNALESSRHAIESAGHLLSVEMPEQTLWIDGDLTRLAQVVSNLLNNAAKYTPSGGRIELSAQAQGGQAEIRVRDNGTGISADMLPRVFDLFAQVDGNLARSQGGLGIGLSLVRQLVELHEGEITAESPGLGQGSCFTVRLPLASGPNGPGNAGEPWAAAVSRRRVLVVDDNIDGAESLALMLGMLGHTVRTVHDGPQALLAAADWRPDVVLLDIGLPGLTGYEVARRLRSDRSTSGMLLVAVTGWGTAEDQRKSAEAGFDHHLTKPVEAGALEAVLMRRLRAAEPQSLDPV